MVLAKPIRRLIEAFERLPGVGPKTAARLTFYLLHVPQSELEEFAGALSNLKKETVLCSICLNVAECDPCPICTDTGRNKSLICVVEQPLDVLALEKAGDYQGVYHVLHGAINPLQNIGPDELHMKELFVRVENGNPKIEEIVLAMNPNMEGEATAMYIAKKLRELPITNKQSLLLRNNQLRITRLGQGLPTGGDIEYADEVTLSRAMEGRREY